MNNVSYEEWVVETEYKHLKLLEWMNSAEDEFEAWADNARESAIAEAKEKGEEWTEWDEAQLEKWILDQKDKDNEKELEKFEDWYDEHREKWIEKMREKWEEMNEEAASDGPS